VLISSQNGSISAPGADMNKLGDILVWWVDILKTEKQQCRCADITLNNFGTKANFMEKR